MFRERTAYQQYYTSSRGLALSYHGHTRYDAVGNRLTQDDNGSVTTYTHNSANQIQSTTSASGNQTNFGFDGNGNLLWKSEPSGMTAYTWDFENRLRQVASASGATDFGYDANGARVFRESGGVRTDYLIDVVSVLAVYEAGVKKAAYVLGPRVDEVISEAIAGGTLWYSPDALGSVTLVTGANGGVAYEGRYASWGQVLQGRGDVLPSYGWHAKRRDGGELHYFLKRYYSFTTGTFLSKDPTPALNYYSAFDNDPINRVDPFGAQAQPTNTITPFVTVRYVGKIELQLPCSATGKIGSMSSGEEVLLVMGIATALSLTTYMTGSYICWQPAQGSNASSGCMMISRASFLQKPLAVVYDAAQMSGCGERFLGNFVQVTVKYKAVNKQSPDVCNSLASTIIHEWVHAIAELKGIQHNGEVCIQGYGCAPDTSELLAGFVERGMTQ